MISKEVREELKKEMKKNLMIAGDYERMMNQEKNVIRFEVPGEPKAQGRPRAVRVGNGIRMYDPKGSAEYKRLVSLYAKRVAPREPLTGPLEVEIEVYRSIPKSLPKYKRAKIEAGELFPVTKPDVDNYGKTPLDALNKLIWKDDSQIHRLTIAKYYSDRPRLEITIKEIGK